MADFKKARLHKIWLVGESHRNEDGSSRQDELAVCSEGEPVQLERQPNNTRDKNAVLVRSARGIGIGYISRDDAWIASLMDAGIPIRGVINEIQGGDGRKLYGCIIRIRTGGKNPDRPVPIDQWRPKRNSALAQSDPREPRSIWPIITVILFAIWLLVIFGDAAG